MKQVLIYFITAVGWLFLAIAAICNWEINYRLGYIVMAFVLCATSVLTGLRAWITKHE